MDKIELLQQLKAMYAEVDAQAGKLEIIHAERLKCGRGCSSCCIDGITVFEIEAEHIRTNHADFLKNQSPNTKAGCAFLGAEGACRIYENRPYVCRTQGLPLRWLEEIDNEIVEYRDICPLNEEGEPIENLAQEKCWTIGEFESKLAGIQVQLDENMTRIALRDLFVSEAETRM